METETANGPRRAESPQRRLGELERRLTQMGSMVIAFSGGVDSTFLLRAAANVRGLSFLAVTTDSPTNTAEEVDEARRLARGFGVRHEVISTDELDTPGYAANPAFRCYLCKQTLYPLCYRLAERHGLRFVVDGVNVDDLGDYRPGLRAASELGVRHPLVEAGLTKRDIRELSALWGLPTADRPASPCLSSRFPYGTAITHRRLEQVARAERSMRGLGFVELRVRHLGHGARVEVAARELARLNDARVREAVVERVRAAGFPTVELCSSPLRSGSLNDELGPERWGAK